MLAEKKPLGVEELEAQTALELPDRNMMALLTVVVAGNEIVKNVDVAANVCVGNVGVLQEGPVDVAQQCRANAS